MFLKFKYIWLNSLSATRITLKLRANQALLKKAKRQTAPIFYDSKIDYEEDVYMQAEECFRKFSYFPISFSFPGIFAGTHATKKNIISRIIPYEKYAFASQDEYYKEYGNSYLGITQKKGGYDCFRHVEIIASGAVPLFLKSKLIPRFTMIHYPKKFMEKVEEQYLKNAMIPSLETINSLSKHANDHLTCRAMCLYFSKLGKLDVSKNDTILFVDSTLHLQPDYLSIFNYIGLKQVYGSQIQSLYPEPEYVYTNTKTLTSDLYGRGFGYTKILDSHPKPNISVNRIKYIVISNLEKDWRLIEDLQMELPGRQFLLFWGADAPISGEVFELTKTLKSSTLFVREIY